MPTFANGHALLIGVGEYRDRNWSTRVSTADAAGVAETLRDRRLGGYPPAQVTLLTDRHATRAGVTRALQQLAERVGYDDTVLLLLCGHGLLDPDGHYHFATHDAVFTADERIKAGTGLSREALLPLLRAIRAPRLLVLINSCFSGHMHTRALGAPPAATLGDDILEAGEGRVLITASRPHETSNYQHGAPRTFFGQALIDGLRGQAAGPGGYIGLYELYQQIYARVQADMAQIGRYQEPVLTVQRGVGPFPVALAPGAVLGRLNPSAIQQELPQAGAVEVRERRPAQVHAEGSGAQAFNKLIDMNDVQVSGNLTMSHIAGGNVVSVDIKVNAAAMGSPATLLQMIGQLQADLAALSGIPDDERDDLADALRRAQQAGQDHKRQRLLDQLGLAQTILRRLSATLPTARQPSELLDALIKRAAQVF